jgi:hypothetical protein
MKKKKNQYLATSKSIIRQSEPFILTYLFWNIIHKAWKIILASKAHLREKVNHYQAIILQFLQKVENTTPFTEIGRLQLYIMLEKIPPKSG